MIYDNLEIPTIVLSTKSHEHLGVLHGVDHSTIQLVRNMNSAQEVSFDVHKSIDGVEEPLWESLVSFKYIYIPNGGVITGEPGEYYSIEVSVDDTNETIKHVTGTSACEFELSKRKLYDFEINTNADIEYQTQQYKKKYNKEPDDEVVETWGTKFYKALDPEHSLLHRVLKDKCPDYHIGYVTPALASKQRTFSSNGQSVYDFLTQTVAKELECVFEFDSATRTISAYSLKMHCDDCDEDGELAAVCPNCGSTNYHNYYGEATNIFISAENYAEQISCTGDVDNVFNCLRVSGGDNLITTSFMYVNPTGTQYMYRFSEDMYKDMPQALVDKIRDYNELYEEKKPDAEALSLDYYNKLDLLSQYKHGVPSISPVTTTATKEAQELPGRFEDFFDNDFSFLDDYDHCIVIQCGENISSIDTPPNYSTANNAVKGLAEVLVDARYNVEVTGTLSGSGTDVRTWTGTVEIKNKGDENDKATSSEFSVNISRTIDKSEIESQDTAAQYLYQRILKRMDRDDRYFKNVFELPTVEAFEAEIQRTYDEGKYDGKPVYGLELLKAFQKSYESCVNIMVENHVTDENSEFYGMKLYETMYQPYAERLEKLNIEIGVRDTQIKAQDAEVTAAKEALDALHEELDFEKYLGQIKGYFHGGNFYKNQEYSVLIEPESGKTYVDIPTLKRYGWNGSVYVEKDANDRDLWQVFCHYRMESEYTNSYYVSDGLDNAQILEEARKLYEVAEKEVKKASEIQYSLSCSLNNLLQDKQFAPYVDKVKLGNWLTLLSDEKPYALRLTQLTVDYGNLASIGVTFSDAIRLGTVVDDVQSILSKATSMSSSYDTVAHQSQQGEEAHERVTDWVADGLNTALVALKNNTTEEVTYDENGILLRSYDDVFTTYSPYQCRMTHNVLAFTKDNWDTCALAIGQSKYARYVEQSVGDGSITTNNYGYGVCAEFVSAGYVYGSQIISGDIYSENYRKVTVGGQIRQFGTHIDLNNGEFSIADGQIRFENNNLIIELGGKDLNDAVESVEVLYAKNTDPDHAPTSSSDWHDTMPARNEGEYLWQKTTTTYFNKQPDVSIVNITGIDGEQGKDGRGIDHIDVWYNKSSASTARPSTFPYDDPEDVPISAGEYLWKQSIYYDQNNQVIQTTYEYSKQGDTGPTGTGISTVISQYAIRTGTTSGASYYKDWQDKMPDYDATCYANNYYYWGRDKITYDDGTPTKYTDPVVLYGTTTSAQISYDAKTLATEMGEQYVLSVGSGDKIVRMQLKSSPSQGSEFKVGANNISLTADETISLMAGGNINLAGKGIVISSDNFKVTAGGELTSKLGLIGGWEINETSIFSNLDGTSTIRYPLYASTNSKENNKYKNTTARCRITINGYTTFTLKVLSNGEKGYDYVCVGNLDQTNITASSSTSTSIKATFVNDSNQATNTSDTRDYMDASVYSGHEVQFTSIASGSHIIEVIYHKDGSNDYGLDKGFFYVDESQCTGSGTWSVSSVDSETDKANNYPWIEYCSINPSAASSNDFKLSTANFTRTINGTSRSNLRMAVSDKFAIDKSGQIFATAGTLGKWTLDSDSIFTGSKTGNATGDVRLSSIDFPRTINGTSRSNLRMAFGDKFAVSSNGSIYSSYGIIGGWDIGSTSLKSSLGSSSATGSYTFSNSQYWVTNTTVGGYRLYQSTNSSSSESSTSSDPYKDTTARCTLTINNYETFTIMVLTNGEKNWDFVCVGTLDSTNISKNNSTSSTIYYTGYGKSTTTTNINVQDTSLYTPVIFENLDGGTHTIEIIYAKDSSQWAGTDAGYFYVDASQCKDYGGADFMLSTADFTRSIGGTSRSALRMAINNDFAVDSSGKMYACAGVIGGWTIGTNALYNTTTSPSSTSPGAIVSTVNGVIFGTGSGTSFRKTRLKEEIIGYATTSLLQTYKLNTIAGTDGSYSVYKGTLELDNKSTSSGYTSKTLTLNGDLIEMQVGSVTHLKASYSGGLQARNIYFGDNFQYSPAPFMNFTINNGSSQRINLTTGTRATLIFNTAYGSGNGIGNLYRESGGSSKWAAMVTPSSVTVSAATQGTTITNSTGYVLNVGVFIFTGTVTLA